MAGERVVVAGGAGFVGSAFVRALLAAEPGTEVVTFDALTYAGHRASLEGLPDASRHRLVVGNVADLDAVERCFDEASPTAVVNLAAESHVDQSLEDPARFVRTNVLGAETLLSATRRRGIRLLQVSTDEVYGSLPAPEAATPDRALRPSSPYAGSKAAADLLALAAHASYGQDVVVTRCVNNYGPRQLPEKLVPLMIERARAGAPLPVYGDGRQARDWLHVEDHAEGLLRALRRGRPGAVHHFAGEGPRENLGVVEALRRACGSRSEVRHVTDRPAHDRRYALDDRATRRELGWAPRIPFERGLAETLAWYAANGAWLAAVRTPALEAFLARHYAGR
jgi:dTDP-glucose 4,6-dehydratase